MSDIDKDRNENFRSPSDAGATPDLDLLDVTDQMRTTSLAERENRSSLDADFPWKCRDGAIDDTTTLASEELSSKNVYKSDMFNEFGKTDESLSDDNFEVICSPNAPSLESGSLITSTANTDSTFNDSYLINASEGQVTERQMVSAAEQWNPYDVQPELIFNDSFQYPAYYSPYVYQWQSYVGDYSPLIVNVGETNGTQYITNSEQIINEDNAEAGNTIETTSQVPSQSDPMPNMFLDGRVDPTVNTYLESEPNQRVRHTFQEQEEGRSSDVSYSHYENPPTSTFTFMGEELDFHNPTFHYPCIYVSQSGLITVLLKNDISIEMTTDRTIRVVSHQRKMAAATSSRGNASCIYHPVAKIKQESTCVDVDLYLGRRVRMTTENITFSNMFQSFNFDYKGIRSLEKDDIIFPDISHDYSVNMLFASTGYGEEIIAQCMELARNALYENLSNGAFVVKINGVKIMQYPRGDVSVLSGPKFIKVSPNTGSIYLQTHFAEMSVEINWSVKIRRGSHTLNASTLGFSVANGKIEAGFNEDNKMRAYKLPERTPLLVRERSRLTRHQQDQGSGHNIGSANGILSG